VDDLLCLLVKIIKIKSICVLFFPGQTEPK